MAPRSSTSRTVWELRAEQVMDRVFQGAFAAPAPASTAHPPAAAQSTAEAARAAARESVRTAAAVAAGVGAVASPAEPAIEVEVREERPFGSRFFGGARLFPIDWPAPEWTREMRHWKPQLPSLSLDAQLLAAVLGLLALFTAGSSVLLWRGWNQARLDLRQERNLQLLERLRTIGFGATVASAPAAPLLDPASKDKTLTLGATGVSTLPPPPPEEAWMQQLEPLQGGGGGGGGGSAAAPRSSNVLRVPVSRSLTHPGPPPPVGASSAGSSVSRSDGDGGSAGGGPELVGVVQVPGRSGSAIFQVGSSSSSVGVGEMIGSSGWRLRSASGDSAVIEKGSTQRMVSISGGF
ncbi:hypothetical protein [Cyanobium sp. Morenito 9A2]|uniref:hypothetical protein n=1 Tax=Cyanobium sp. Morenito 9A2 TaxID=2823718 RepID=UPI0020CD7DEE|nr:hypothetical protein [Cyanobium sp. Morenito 9A2]MCP9850406.1 hypothetical protein [Cyanobium sp. Morenito 9A2]